MRTLLLAVLMAACGNSPGPRLIHGGGIGDGSIDGTLNVYVIDHDTEAPIQGATVEVGKTQKMSDKNGLSVFDASGAQTVTVSASGYRGTVWMKVDGANVTIPVTKLGTPTPQQATLAGSINNWSSVTVPTNHLKVAFVLYSQDSKLGNAENNIQTPGGGNVCGFGGGATCDWTIATRTGAVTLMAAVIDYDTKGTATQADDTQTLIGWAMKTDIQVDSGVNQTGLTLDLVDAGNLENVSIDYGSPPAALTTHNALVGYELGTDEIVQIPAIPAGSTSLLVPKIAAFPNGTTRRLTAVAQDSATPPASSIVLRTNLSGTSLAAGSWLDPPTGATVSRTNASFTAVSGAIAHGAQWSDGTGEILEITCFDSKTTSFDVPNLVALPTTGALTAQVTAIAADFSVTDFSLDDDRDKLTGLSAQPATVP
jgi:hypothetical protein